MGGGLEGHKDSIFPKEITWAKARDQCRNCWITWSHYALTFRLERVMCASQYSLWACSVF
jgi:hypothetical protein